MPPQQQQQQPTKGQIAAELLVMLLAAGLQASVLWLQLPGDQRFWIRLAVAGRVRSSAARLAWSMGHRGMAEEIRTGQRSIRYLAAWGLSTVRDQAQQALEAMRP